MFAHFYITNWKDMVILGCFNFICFVICVCVFVILTFTVFCLCNLYCFVVILLFYCFVLFMFCSCFVYLYFCTSVGLLPPGESPIAVSNNNNKNTSKIFCMWHWSIRQTFDHLCSKYPQTRICLFLTYRFCYCYPIFAEM
jgi:hypothetical protein